MKLIDIGCNLASKPLYKNLDDILKAAEENNVAEQIITGSDLDSNEKCLALAHKYPKLHSTVGFHPHHANQWQPQQHSVILQSAVKSKHCVAVGEMGLDYCRNLSSRYHQQRCFIDQLEIAVNAQKPVFLHVREAVPDFKSIFTPYLSKLSGAVWHCFTESEAALTWAVEQGISIGITGWICDPNRGQLLREIVKYIPNELIMIETDAPYLTPKTIIPTPRINKPQYLYEVLKQLAISRGQDIDELAEITFQNSKRFFNI